MRNIHSGSACYSRTRLDTPEYFSCTGLFCGRLFRRRKSYVSVLYTLFDLLLLYANIIQLQLLYNFILFLKKEKITLTTFS